MPENFEACLPEFVLDHLGGYDKTVLVFSATAFGYAPLFQPMAFPGFVVSIHPQGEDERVARHPVKLAQDQLSVFRRFDMVQEADTENAVDGIGGEIQCKSGGLKALDPRHDLRRLIASGHGQHVG